MIHIRKFNLEEIQDGSVTLILGSASGGVTTLLNDVLSKLYHRFSTCLVYDCFETERKGWPKYAQENGVFLHDSIENLDKVLDYQRSRDQSKMLISFDQYIWLNTLHRNTVKELIANCASLNITVVLSSNALAEAPFFIRDKLENIFQLRNTIPEQKRILRNFAKIERYSESIFGEIYDHCTKNFKCLVLPISENESQPFWYKADTDALFKLSTEFAWKMFSPIAMILLRKKVAIYIILDVFNFVSADVIRRTFAKESVTLDCKKIALISAIKRMFHV